VRSRAGSVQASDGAGRKRQPQLADPNWVLPTGTKGRLLCRYGACSVLVHVGYRDQRQVERGWAPHSPRVRRNIAGFLQEHERECGGPLLHLRPRICSVLGPTAVKRTLGRDERNSSDAAAAASHGQRNPGTPARGISGPSMEPVERKRRSLISGQDKQSGRAGSVGTHQ
jgi:hypothetical protein